VKAAIDGDADGIVMRDSVLAEVGAEVVGRGSAAGAIDPVQMCLKLLYAIIAQAEAYIEIDGERFCFCRGTMAVEDRSHSFA